jgi:hypothetical protein
MMGTEMSKQERDRRLAELGKQVKALFPDMFGSVRFNLNPRKDTTNVNIEEAVLIENRHDNQQMNTVALTA